MIVIATGQIKEGIVATDHTSEQLYDFNMSKHMRTHIHLSLYYNNY